MKEVVGMDIFAGAGGMSLGAKMAGIDVKLAIEKDIRAAQTYSKNHPGTQVIVDDIANISQINISKRNRISILFGGPPCQGFSTSNQRTRHYNNETNWLFTEFVRIAKLWCPDWIVFENVRGIVETEGGLFFNQVIKEIEALGYSTSWGILCASNFGVPQLRSRFFAVASLRGTKIKMPSPVTKKPITVRQAISDLPKLINGANIDSIPYPHKARCKYAQNMRNGSKGCSNHLVSNNAQYIIERYKHIPQGGNWEDIPANLMTNYKDRARCHTGIYRRLHEDQPSVVIGNYRKNMLVHPTEDRGLSVREAARLQSFPDWYDFSGSIGFQQQQVANAVPPLLAKAVFCQITETL